MVIAFAGNWVAGCGERDRCREQCLEGGFYGADYLKWNR